MVLLLYIWCYRQESAGSREPETVGFLVLVLEVRNCLDLRGNVAGGTWLGGTPGESMVGDLDIGGRNRLNRLPEHQNRIVTNRGENTVLRSRLSIAFVKTSQKSQKSQNQNQILPKREPASLLGLT